MAGFGTFWDRPSRGIWCSGSGLRGAAAEAWASMPSCRWLNLSKDCCPADTPDINTTSYQTWYKHSRPRDPTASLAPGGRRHKGASPSYLGWSQAAFKHHSDKLLLTFSRSCCCSGYSLGLFSPKNEGAWKPTCSDVHVWGFRWSGISTKKLLCW